MKYIYAHIRYDRRKDMRGSAYIMCGSVSVCTHVHECSGRGNISQSKTRDASRTRQSEDVLECTVLCTSIPDD